MTNRKFADLFGAPVRNPDKDLLTPFHMNIAASIQKVTEEIMLRLSRSLAREHGVENLCLAGGVALNCVANGKILRDGAFKNIWIQPAAGDAGGAVGAALATWHQFLGNERKLNGSRDLMEGAFLGPAFAQARCGKPSPEGWRQFQSRLRRGRHREDGDLAGRRRSRRLDAGPYGIRAARIGRTLHPRRSALADYAEDT